MPDYLAGKQAKDFTHMINDEYKKILSDNSLRITNPRLEIIKILRENHKPLTIAEIHKKIKNRKTDLATVYRTLNSFIKAKFVNEINFNDEYKRYELIIDRHHHHHIVCNVCKKIENIDRCITNEIEKDLKKKGYEDISHSLEFFGTCSECKELIK
ncbi:MAG TPA: Fur family transcriptional regulator [Ignavibacteria bacterium]|nr:Fur family transcriptional regulator [Ignavibacteria bacterium]